MKNNFNPIFTFILISSIVTPLFSFSQDHDVEMADIMRENGKIYVVVAVISIILAGLLIALISVDRRLKRVEKGKKQL